MLNIRLILAKAKPLEIPLTSTRLLSIMLNLSKKNEWGFKVLNCNYIIPIIRWGNVLLPAIEVLSLHEQLFFDPTLLWCVHWESEQVWKNQLSIYALAAVCLGNSMDSVRKSQPTHIYSFKAFLYHFINIYHSNTISSGMAVSVLNTSGKV